MGYVSWALLCYSFFILFWFCMPLLCLLLIFLSRGLLKYIDEHKLCCMPLSNATDNLPSSLVKSGYRHAVFFLAIRLLSGWCSFSVLFAFSFFTVLPCGMEFKQHCTGLSKHGELQQGTTCSAFRGGDRLLTKLMLLSHCEKVPNIFVLGPGLLKTDVIRRILWRNVNWCVKYSSFHSVKVGFLQHLK